MKQKILIFFLLSVLFGCNMPTELPVFESMKPADKFARTFIDRIIKGQLDSVFAVIETEILNDEATKYITDVSKNMNGAITKKYKVVESTFTTSYVFHKGKITNYRLGYEYEFEKMYVLFTTTIKEKDGKLSVLSFNGEVLQVPLSELTSFTLLGKTPLQYIFFILCILVPVFILTTLVIMLFSKMTTKKKIIWSLIILFISFPRFVINWNSGEMDFNLINFILLGGGFIKPALYSAWLLTFHIPIGAIIFLNKRESLLSKKEDTVYENIEESLDTQKTITNE